MNVPFVRHPDLRHINQQGYTLVRYKKPLSDYSLGIYRSVVYKGGKLVCFSPPNSMPLPMFLDQHPTHTTEEFVEGTMVNAFYDTKWVLCTKSSVGANCRFHDTAPTFRQMFFEAFPNLDLLNPDYVYSFVLRHPLNRIVELVLTPQVTLVAMYRIVDDAVHQVPLDTRFPTPRRLDGAKGRIFKSGFARAKMRNPEYEVAAQLNFNCSNFTVQTIKLWQTQQLDLFAKYYPDLMPRVTSILALFTTFAHTLLSTYVKAYIHKTAQRPLYLVPYLFELHQIYLANRVRVTKDTVYRYLATVPAVTLAATIQRSPKDNRPKYPSPTPSTPTTRAAPQHRVVAEPPQDTAEPNAEPWEIVP
jgi:hypothetical protein